MADVQGDARSGRSGTEGTEALLRRLADGEAQGSDAAAAERHLASHPGDVHFVDSERRLRGACARVMDARCPAAVRERVERVLAGEVIGSIGGRAGSSGSVAGGRSGGLVGWFAAPGRAGMALAAALVLVMSVGVIVLAQRSSGGYEAWHGHSTQQVEYSGRVATFVAREHFRCAGAAEAAAKFLDQQESAAPLKVREILGVEAHVPVCETLGLVFRGVAPCGVPGEGPSAHLMFEEGEAAGPSGRRISVFVRRDGGELNLVEGKVYELDVPGSAGASGGASGVYAWSSEGLLYLVVADEQRGPVCEKLIASLSGN